MIKRTRNVNIIIKEGKKEESSKKFQHRHQRRKERKSSKKLQYHHERRKEEKKTKRICIRRQRGRHKEYALL